MLDSLSQFEDANLKNDFHDFVDLATSPEIDQLFLALAMAQSEMSDPAKNKTANVPMKTGGKYSYKYSDLADILKIIRPVFGKHGLFLLQLPTNPRPGSVRIINRVSHKSGQWLQFALTLPVGDDKPQTLGSAITYGRRYSAAGIAGIAPDEDEDGQTAQDAAPAKQISPTSIRYVGPQSVPVPHASADKTAYNGGDTHRAVLRKILISRNISPSYFDQIDGEMIGKTFNDLDSVIKSAQNGDYQQ